MKLTYTYIYPWISTYAGRLGTFGLGKQFDHKINYLYFAWYDWEVFN